MPADFAPKARVTAETETLAQRVALGWEVNSTCASRKPRPVNGKEYHHGQRYGKPRREH